MPDHTIVDFVQLMLRAVLARGSRISSLKCTTTILTMYSRQHDSIDEEKDGELPLLWGVEGVYQLRTSSFVSSTGNASFMYD